MKVDVQYLNDSNGKIQAVQVPVTEWEKLIAKVKKMEQSLKIKADLSEAFEQMTALRKSKHKKS